MQKKCKDWTQSYQPTQGQQRSGHFFSFFRDICKLFSFILSVFILDGKCHGWYIHGKSLHEFADCSMEEMNQNIEKERVNISYFSSIFGNLVLFQNFDTLQVKLLR